MSDFSSVIGYPQNPPIPPYAHTPIQSFWNCPRPITFQLPRTPGALRVPVFLWIIIGGVLRYDGIALLPSSFLRGLRFCLIPMRTLHVSILFITVLVAGCFGSGRLRYDTPKEAYDKGVERFEVGKYERAAQYFQGAFDFGRTHEWADDSQLYLARAYRADRQYILAASEYSRFAEIYRGDERVPLAEFERAMTYYERSPGYQLDQTDTQRGIEVFNLYMKRYPGHDSIEVAAQRVLQLRQKLAHKQYNTAQLYDRRGLYEAAALSYEAVFDKFPDTPWADDALLSAIRAYIAFSNQSIASRQPERLQKAIDHYQRLLQIFPDSEVLKEAELLYERANAQMERLIPTPAQG